MNQKISRKFIQKFIQFSTIIFLSTATFSCCNDNSSENIVHSVFFKLKHEKGSVGERIFLDKATALGNLPFVIDLKCVVELSPKNDFDFGLTMQFKNMEDYMAYNNHPKHVEFVEEVWKKEVFDFMEIDYTLKSK
jgi:hypothetical protein